MLIAEYVKGWRLADLLDVAETENVTFDVGVVMLLLRQLLPTAAMLSSQSRDTASGALGPEHLLLTPQGRIVLTDYVLGPAIEALERESERLWRSLRVATAAADRAGGGRSRRAATWSRWASPCCRWCSDAGCATTSSPSASKCWSAARASERRPWSMRRSPTACAPG